MRTDLSQRFLKELGKVSGSRTHQYVYFPELRDCSDHQGRRDYVSKQLAIHALRIWKKTVAKRIIRRPHAVNRVRRNGRGAWLLRELGIANRYILTTAMVDFYRHQLLETGFARKIMPPMQVEQLQSPQEPQEGPAGGMAAP